MAYIVGLVTKEERATLERRGWEVEDAAKYGLHWQEGNCSYKNPPKNPVEYLMDAPSDGMEAVVIWVDSNVFDVMSGPDWETREVCSECGKVPRSVMVPDSVGKGLHEEMKCSCTDDSE